VLLHADAKVASPVLDQATDFVPVIASNRFNFLIAFIFKIEKAYDGLLICGKGVDTTGQPVKPGFFCQLIAGMQFFGRLHKFGIEGADPDPAGGSQLHEAVVLCQHIQPTLKVGDFVPDQLCSQLLEDLHDRVFR